MLVGLRSAWRDNFNLDKAVRIKHICVMHPTASGTPMFDVSFRFFNASVFNVTASYESGRIKLDGWPLSGVIDPSEVSCERLKWATLKLLHVGFSQQNADAMITARGNFVLDVSDLKIRLSVGRKKMAKLYLPNELQMDNWGAVLGD